MLNKQTLILLVLAWYAFNMFVSQSTIAYLLLGFALVFLVPGYSWVDTAVKTEDELERFVLAVALSISLVIISIVWMNLVFKIKITRASILADIGLISIAGLVWENRALIGMKAKAVKPSETKKVKQKVSKKKKKTKKRKK